MDKVWSSMILISFIITLLFGNVQKIIEVMFKSSEIAIQTCISMAGMLCLWSGFIKIASNCGIVEKMSKLLNPIIKWLFPELDHRTDAKGHIAMNMTANILGLGNIATPMGLKAMSELQKVNRDKSTISKSMIMFIVINTASVQLIPTTVLALRTVTGSNNPAIVVVPTLIASAISLMFAIFAAKLCAKIYFKRGDRT